MIGARGSDPVAHGNLADCREDIEALDLAGNDVAALITATLYGEGLSGDADRPWQTFWLRLLDQLGTSGLNANNREAKRALDQWLDKAAIAHTLNPSRAASASIFSPCKACFRDGDFSRAASLPKL